MRAILVLVLLQAQTPSLHATPHGAARHARAPVEKSPATAAPVFRIDGLIATEQEGRLSIQAKGAVAGGGWKHAALKLTKSGNPADAHVLVLDFVAEPPDPADAVIPGLLPVNAAIALNGRKGLVSVRVVSGSNEITTQILRSGR